MRESIMVKRNRNVNGENKKISKKINTGSLKGYAILAVFVLALIVQDAGVHAAEQTPGQQPGAQAEPAATGVEISGTTMMYAVRNVNVRSGPDTTTEILGELEAGTNIFAVELTDGGWYRVVYGGETGYIRGDFLAVFGNMPEWTDSEPEPELEPETDGEPAENGDADSAGDGSDSHTAGNNENSHDAENAGNGAAAENTEGGTADNAAGGEAEDAKAAPTQGQDGGKNNIFTILIIVALVTAIFVYAVIQIVKDNMNPEGGSAEDSEDEPEGEESEEDIDADGED